MKTAAARTTKRRVEPVPDARPYARKLFAQLAQHFIMPAGDLDESGLIFDIETDGLLDAVTKVHCICIIALNDDRVHEYGPGQIADALAHLARAGTLIGHNAQSYDLSVLRKLYGWAPPSACRIVDTLIAGRLILPHLDRVDGEVASRAKDAAFGRIRGRHSLEAWGVRLGAAKIGAEIEDWASTNDSGNSCSRAVTRAQRSTLSTPSPPSASGSPRTACRSICKQRSGWASPGKHGEPSSRKNCAPSFRH